MKSQVQVLFCGSWILKDVEMISGIPCVSVDAHASKTFLYWRGATVGDSCIKEWIPISDDMREWYHSAPESPIGE